MKFHKDFVKVEGDKIVIGIKSRPEKGKANLELIRKLAKHFNVPASQIKIITGHTARRKIVEVLGK
ncbi:MAG: DUF167 domain-containing protein [Candidatus Bathyarchaeia archaeon]